MTARGLVERLVGVTVREVEARPPAPLVEERGEVVVRVDEVAVVGVPLIDARGVGVKALVLADGGLDVRCRGQVALLLL